MPDQTIKRNSVADETANFRDQVQALRAAFEENAQAWRTGGQPKWVFPDLKGWSGDTDDYDGMSTPFDRSEANDMFVEAVADPQSPGVSGDAVVCQVQVEYLAVMERAFRARHAEPVHRAVAHAAGRTAGHGSEQGPLVVCALEFVRRLVREAKGAQK